VLLSLLNPGQFFPLSLFNIIKQLFFLISVRRERAYLGRANRQVSQDSASPQRSSDGSSLQPRRIAHSLQQLRRPVPHLGHRLRTVPQDPDRRRQSARFVRQVLPERQVHPSRHLRQVSSQNFNSKAAGKVLIYLS